ncbi:hypothetical protein RJ639_022083 [Escallonia herrerae]|uniref:Helicase C-terminal domain-containing protein n=1 Tax=Escallonia herrerae TaxID=1293975 RepID=A0AA89AI09_9ASTE|nr:hypothetical protein RJ639_022083 [Escallonia herrerae]
MDSLKSHKKQRISRRSKQLDEFEQKLKEFFSEIQSHKCNLALFAYLIWKLYLSSNQCLDFRIIFYKFGVMSDATTITDAKSDRVMQLLKETEKYLQKLGSKLQDAKAIKCIQMGVNENQINKLLCSVQENIVDQPTCLVGGKLREYHMDGLRWLVSLYNNHLSGILADEMGLGKIVQNNLEELWSLLNFLLPNIFNSSEDFSQWFNKPFESNDSSSPNEALLSEEENLLITNRLHQVLRPFVLRRLKEKVENELPEKIERLVRCEASAYQKLLMKRVQEHLGGFGTSKARSVFNPVLEQRNICNHPYLSRLHVEEVHDLIPKHYLPNFVRLCGKLEMLDRLLPKLKATDHRIDTSLSRWIGGVEYGGGGVWGAVGWVVDLERFSLVLLFSTMTRLLDVMEDYLGWKQYRYLRLDGHTPGGDRGGLIDQFNQPDSPYFVFLLSIRAGGVGVNLQAADTVIIFDADWNPQAVESASHGKGSQDWSEEGCAYSSFRNCEYSDLGVKMFMVPLLVQSVEEQVRAAAEHKLGVANQSITAGFFDNSTSAEDRREYLESLLRECKKEEAAPVLHDDALNDLIARSESEIDIFQSIDQERQEEDMTAWKNLASSQEVVGSEAVLSLPARLLTDDDLRPFCEAMKISDAPCPVEVSNDSVLRKSGSHVYHGIQDTHLHGRGKRVHCYDEQWTEDHVEDLSQVDSSESPRLTGDAKENILVMATSASVAVVGEAGATPLPSEEPQQPFVEMPREQSKEVSPPSR